jgi:type I restriction enzyme S subunit
MRPYMRAANVTWGGVSLHDVKEMDFTDAEFETYRLRPLDILLAEASGSASEVGKPAVWRDEVQGSCFQNTLIRVRSHEVALVPYLYWHFLNDARNKRFSKAARGTGIHHLGAKTLENWQVQLAPLAEQHRIVAEIEKQFTRLDAAVATLVPRQFFCAFGGPKTLSTSLRVAG